MAPEEGTTRGGAFPWTPTERALSSACVTADACRDFSVSSKLEWIEANGTGGFAMGTVAGVNTRRYHGLLVGALRPPVDRHVLLSKVEEVLRVDERDHDLGTSQYPGVVAPQGYRALDGFRVDPFPTWTYACDATILEKRLFMMRGKQAVVLQYTSNRPCKLRVRPFLAYRNFHALTHLNSTLDRRVTHTRSSPNAATLRIAPYDGLPTLSIHHSGAALDDGACWYRATEYLAELDRGLDFREDLYCTGIIEFAVDPRRPAWIVATIDKNGDWDYRRVASEEAVEREARRSTAEGSFVARLENAANSFRARRADGSPTIIAGYPWFVDWGRDTMIALPGLLIARRLLDEARDVLTGFLERLDHGLIPNRFVDGSDPPEYNTADATLWMFHAVQEYVRAGGNRRWARDTFYPRAKEVIAWHERGTHYGIRVDPGDALLVSGDAGTQLTWMDAKVGDCVVTARSGKAVEINALWLNALRFLEELAAEYRDAEYAAELNVKANRVQHSLARDFWNGQAGCLYDVLLPDGPDARIRPNQIFAVSLPYSALTNEQSKSVVRVVERDLLTPYGLRTLARGDPQYQPRYGGDPSSRDSAYHQGTVWPWLLGPFVTGYLNAFGRTSANRAYVRSLLVPLEAHLDEACLGQVSEVFDAEPPHRPGGAPAQAWSVAELLRVLKTEVGDP